ncbi:Gfo/Idh/MocA family oxidoreductase [Georgenia halophila]|uniref:Gfo/Idh/MocA family oxidoreductase n=1 Tax=Georgenia halophila TaxID=620889 RepID=A0ABP8LGR0_9MICO
MPLPVAFPQPDLFREDSSPPLRWGVIGPGWIASEFVRALHAHSSQRVVAVASRAEDRAAEFAGRLGIPHHSGSVDEVVNRDDVDIVYVAAPQSEHNRLARIAIGAGKHILVEKPLATCADDARALLGAARGAGVFAMEALWSRYLPQASIVRRLIEDGELGDVDVLLADQGQAIPPGHQIMDPDLGGGALLDLGVYPVAMSSELFGAPERVVATGSLTDTGVDSYASVALEFSSNRHAALTANIRTRTPGKAVIAGSRARIEMGGALPFHAPTTLTLAEPEFFGPTMTWTDPTGLAGFSGLVWEANAASRFISEGRLESPLHTHDETVQILKTLDDARRQVHQGAAE